jgi:organic radical activating enzyme
MQVKSLDQIVAGEPMVSGESMVVAGEPTVADQPSLQSKEWQHTKRWNPFNSFKLLAHVDRWRNIKRGKPIPPPLLVTVDPSNVCNLNCAWCNAAFIRSSRHQMLSEKALFSIADFLPHWGEENNNPYSGVKAVCIAGGGEPLMNPAVGKFIDRLVENEIEVGVVTNGIFMHRYIDSLSQCTWVGVSVDAGTRETFNRCKGLPDNSRIFDKVIDNIEKLSAYSRYHNNRLGWPHPAYGISFKYLLYRDNIGEIVQATGIAKNAGSKNIHIRPAGTPWDMVNLPEIITFSPDEISLFNEQIIRAQEFDDETFGVYGVTHKFNSQFKAANHFSTCHAVFMTALFQPPATVDSPKDSFTLGLCCDRRGDPRMELVRDSEDVSIIGKEWGSTRHWNVYDAIRIRHDCPRCTYQPHNEIYEQVILNDSMTYNFI